MPKGLYLTAVFFLFFSTPNLWGHWTNLNQTWTHIHIWLLLEKFGPNSLGLGAKYRFLGPTLNLGFDRTYLCNRTRYQQSERNLSIYTYSPACPQVWWTLAQKRLRTVGELLPTPPNIFALGETASLTAWTSYNRQQANFGTWYVVVRAGRLKMREWK